MITPILTVECRLERLERQNRRLRAAVLALAALGIMGAAAGSAAWPDSVTAGAFLLKDEEGRTRAEISIRDGAAGVFILDENGRDRLAATHDAEGTGLFLKDDSGHSRVGLAQFAHGGGGLALHGPEAKGAAVLYFKDRGSLRFYDAEGQVTNQVAATP